MTPEEFNQEIERMLAVQRELQESHLWAMERIDRHDEQIANLLALASEQRAEAARAEAKIDRVNENVSRISEDIDRLARIVNQLVGYSLSNESEHLDYEERLRALEARARRLNGEAN